jgi:4-amino-4-deoxy-L-arabinose transferase-like glycosyltransferase
MKNSISKDGKKVVEVSRKFDFRDLLLISFIVLMSLIYMYFFNSQPITSLGGDQLVYNQIAVNILQKNGFSQSVAPPYKPSIQRTPAYPLFLASIYAVFGLNNFEMVRIIQILLMLCVSVLTFIMAFLVFENKTISYMSLVFCAFFGFDYYTGLGVYGYLFTEPLTIFLVCWAMLFVILARKDNRRIYFILAGVFLALTMLTRPAYLLFPLLVFIFIFSRSLEKKNILNFVVSCTAILICVLPWTVRNYVTFDKIILLSAPLSGLGLFSGAVINNPDFMPYPDADFSVNGVSLPSEDLEHARTELRKLYQVFNYGGDGGLELFVHDKELKKIGLKIIHENYFAFMQRWFYRMMGHWRFGDVANILNGITKKVDATQCAKIALKGLVLLIVTLSIVHGLKNKLFILLLLFPLYNMAIYTPFTPQIRYSLPSYPFVIIIFSAGLFVIFNVLWSQYQKRGPALSEASSVINHQSTN